MISIIIPAYNCSNFIGRTLQCLLDQTYTDFEIVIVDDGSTDDTLTVVTACANQSQKIKAYSIPNGGAYAARLFGVSKAHGEWITFVDADDTLPINALELLISEDDATADIIVGTLDLNHREIFKHKVSGLLSSVHYMEALLLSRTSVGPVAKLYRHDLFQRVLLDLDNCIIHQNEDLLMLMQLSTQAIGIKIAPDKVVYEYIFRENSASRQTRPLTEWFKLFALIEKIINDTPYPHLLSAFMTYRITILYEQGVMKLNNFSMVTADLDRLRSEASKMVLSRNDKRMLDIVLSPFRRSVYGGVNVTKNKVKQFIKRILHHG